MIGKISLNEPIIPFNHLPSINGQEISYSDFKKHRLLVLIFLGIACPYSRNSIPEINRIYARFIEHMDLLAINPHDSIKNPHESLDVMKDYFQNNFISFPFVKDENQIVAKKYGVSRTPEVFLFDKKHKLVYKGRLNDNPLHIHKITRHDLTIALEELFRIKTVLMPLTEPIGTLIEWKSN